MSEGGMEMMTADLQQFLTYVKLLYHFTTKKCI